MFVLIPWVSYELLPLAPHQFDTLEYSGGKVYLQVWNKSSRAYYKCNVFYAKCPAGKVINPNTLRCVYKTGKIGKQVTKVTNSILPNKENKSILYMEDLIGMPVIGVVRRTGPDYHALVVTNIGPVSRFVDNLEELLVSLAKKHIKKKGLNWNVDTPGSWSLQIHSKEGTLGPHVSLNSNVHKGDVGKRISLVVKRVMHWREEHRWVALVCEGQAVDKTDWVLHLSCAQERMA